MISAPIPATSEAMTVRRMAHRSPGAAKAASQRSRSVEGFALHEHQGGHARQ